MSIYCPETPGNSRHQPGAIAFTGIRAIRAGTVVPRHPGGTRSEYALASKRITSDGVDVIIDVSSRSNAREWVRARDDQAAFREVIERYLLNIEWDSDDKACRLTLPTYEGADVIIDPRFGLGQPVLAKQKVRVQDLVDAWWGGDRIEDIAREYRVPFPEAEAAIRTATRHAA